MIARCVRASAVTRARDVGGVRAVGLTMDDARA